MPVGRPCTIGSVLVAPLVPSLTRHGLEDAFLSSAKQRPGFAPQRLAVLGRRDRHHGLHALADRQPSQPGHAVLGGDHVDIAAGRRHRSMEPAGDLRAAVLPGGGSTMIETPPSDCNAARTKST